MLASFLISVSLLCLPSHKEECRKWGEACLADGMAHGFSFAEARHWCVRNVPGKWTWDAKR